MNKIIGPFVVMVGLLLGGLLMLNSLTADTSPISYAVKYVGIGLALLAFVKPKAGIYIVIGEVFFVDYLKKVAVYYGNTSLLTIIEVMVVVMLALVACIAGVFANGQARLNFKTRKDTFAVLFLVLGLVVSFGVIGLNFKRGMMEAFQQGFNTGAYIGIVTVCLAVAHEKADLRKLLFFALVCSTLSAGVAIFQEAFGFSTMEDFYMQTGLSPVASQQYLADANAGLKPRVCGLASGCQNFGGNVGGIALALGALALRPGFFGKIFCILALVAISVAMFLSRMKTGIALVGLCPLAYLLFRNRVFLVTFYTASISLVIYLFVNAEHLRANIAQYDQTFRSFFNLSADYSIQTFEARLAGYALWSDSTYFSLFGIPDDVGSHDMLTSLYIRMGAVPLGFSILVGIVVVFLIHRASFQIPKGEWRNLFLAGLSFFSTGLAANVFGGSNLHSTPWNAMLWLSASMCVFAYINGLKALREEVEEPSKSRREPHQTKKMTLQPIS